MRFGKRAAAAGPTTARHVEIWGHLEENNRFLRRFAGGAIVLALLGLAAGAYGMLVGLYQPLAFHVGADGQASYAGRLREEAGPNEAEVRYVAKLFLQRYMAFNSLTIESDLAEAWNLMTKDLQGQQQEMLDQYKKEHHGDEFVAFVKSQGIQTTLDFDGKRTTITDHNEKTFTIRLVGTMRTWPLNRPDAAFVEKDFESFVTLIRCTRTERTPNGLLVAKITTRTYVPVESGGPGAPQTQKSAAPSAATEE